MVDRSELLRQRLLATFRVEADEHIAAISAELEEIAANPGAPATRGRLETLFRVVHTLKGAARSVGSTDVEQLSHRTEALLRELTQDRLTFDDDILAVLQEASDGLAGLVAGTLPPERVGKITAAIEQRRTSAPGPLLRSLIPVPPPLPGASGPREAESAGPAGEPPASPASVAPTAAVGPAAPSVHGPQMPGTETPAIAGPAASQSLAAATTPPVAGMPPPASEAAVASEPPADGRGTSDRPARSDSIRVDVGRLDRLLVIAEELLIPKLAAAERVRAARVLANAIASLRVGLRRTGQLDDSRHRRLPAEVDDALRGIEADARRLAFALAGDSNALRAVVDDLFGETRRARLTAAAAMLEAFPRMVRDIARETGKEVIWQASGTHIEIDRKILDVIKDPLIHMVRNAIDHGIEPPELRLAAGKPRQGRVGVAITPVEGGQVAIEVTDDGKGLDRAALARAATRSRLLEASQTKTLDDAALLELAFHPGVSTSPVITSISGHGLGLAIVRERVERIDGQVTVQSTPGAGTTIRLVMPASIATSRGLIVRVGGGTYSWPSDSLDAVTGLQRAQVKAVLSSGLLVHGGETLSAGYLAAILGVSASGSADEDRRLLPCLIVRAGKRRGALLVDEVIGESEILVKELRAPLRRVRNISMAGLLGTGELILVLRPSDVLASIHAPASAALVAAESVPRTRRILVVDDSITTRTMERNLFEAAGYAVRVAADGIDAWTILQTDEVDVVVSDIDMPRMNGFDLTSRIREDSRLAQLPVVLVTALEAREDKEQGVRVGANAYVLKSAFDQSNLLEIVGRLV